uniref:Uncharacterized protein n=1 Tax=Rhipicephalus zambeziensis TaxID=60191 RepID=A0A224YFC1_9ACAR
MHKHFYAPLRKLLLLLNRPQRLLGHLTFDAPKWHIVKKCILVAVKFCIRKPQAYLVKNHQTKRDCTSNEKDFVQCWRNLWQKEWLQLQCPYTTNVCCPSRLLKPEQVPINAKLR